jgi:AcrR family transcriptional regulator
VTVEKVALEPPPERARLTREAILETAAGLFRRQGYRRTTLEEVANALAVTRPALYYHFKSKALILSEIQFQAMEGLAGRVAAVDDPAQPASDRFWAALQAHIQYVAERVDEVATVFDVEGELQHVDARRLAAMRRDYTDHFVAVYELAMADGDFERTDSHLAVFGYLGAATWLYRWYRPSPHRRPADVAREMVVALRGPGSTP